MNNSNIAILTDLAGNPVSATPASSLPTGQSSVLSSGSDYAATPKAQLHHIDALGQAYAVPVSISGVQLPVAVNAAGTSTGNFGTVTLGWDSAAGYWRPSAVDAAGASIVRSSQYPTANWSPNVTVATTTTANRSMISFYNNSASAYTHRIVAIYAQCPPQANTTGGLAGIGSGTSYTPIYFEVHRFTTGHSGGTLVTGGSFDTSDTYDTNLTCRYGATISGEQPPVLCQWDAAYDGSKPVAIREDLLQKQIIIPAGSGLHVKCVSGLSTSVAFQLRVITIQSSV